MLVNLTIAYRLQCVHTCGRYLMKLTINLTELK